MSRIEDALERANCLRQNRGADRGSAEPGVPVPLELPLRGVFRRVCFGIPFLVLVCFGGYLLAGNLRIPPLPKAGRGEVQPTLSEPHVGKNAVPGNRAPRFIPLGAPDAAYASAHPGWQRYIAKTMEFRVFREGGSLKAIQVISRQDKAITQELLASFLGEATGTGFYTVLSGAPMGGYFVEKGSAGKGAEVIVYRKKRGREIRALVVAYR